MDKKEIINLYSEYASQFDEKIGALKNYDECYTDFVNGAERKESLLDLACGPANVSSFIQKLSPGINISCVDLSEDMLQLAKAKIGDGDFYASDILSINIPEQSYDLIVCAFGIPYIKRSEIDVFISELARFSTKGSAIYISCMMGDEMAVEPMSFADHKSLVVQRYQKEEIIDSFEKFNFSLETYTSLEYKEPDGSMTTDMIFNFVKN